MIPIVNLVGILSSIEKDINSGTIIELKKAGGPAFYLAMNLGTLVEEFTGLTQALINTIQYNSFSHLTSYLNTICKLRLEQRVRLSDIMTVFDLYETALKDAMSLYLQQDLVSLNYLRREIDTLLDRARVYASEYFFSLYEQTVFKQFEQLRIINELSAHTASSLNLNETLNFIVTNAVRLFKANCGSISLVDKNGEYLTRVSYGWREENSPQILSHSAPLFADITALSGKDPAAGSFKEVFVCERLSKFILLKLRSNQTVTGVLILGFKDDLNFTGNDKRVLFTFANHAAVAVRNAQLYGDTDQKLQEQVHEATVLLEQNRAILHSMREGVIAIDAGGYITAINHEALRMLDDIPELVGKPIEDLIPESRLPIVVATGRAEYDQEYRFGSHGVIVNRVPIIVDGKVTGAIATFRDKQDYKQIAEELIGVKSLLESMRAQSHEFINKLHAISGLIQMEQYDKVVELINQIYQNKQELISFIVKRIHDKATAGLLLGKVSQAEEKGVKLRITSRTRLKTLPAHFSSVAMVTVLGNLVTNAIEAVLDQTAERRVIHVHIFEGKKYLNITVSDNGQGISRQNQKLIFQRGFSTKKGSRGIGLALVRQEVEASGGKIAVQSQQDVGSRFSVMVPLAIK
ncbi:signal transduction histidine kinase sporulation regulator spoob [Lucifera butyrica]|uniref:histidine kinase n=1 Tax=Lucifera butyrica TaxID=1351585 RepID=A0A498R8I8_9FIRM|nr:ATP-binding protein [Lucifera butyrica]VBB07824.1 signal transduction histidine kinase sporulation regulator spoob [Lucifera butyrica]